MEPGGQGWTRLAELAVAFALALVIGFRGLTTAASVWLVAGVPRDRAVIRERWVRYADPTLPDRRRSAQGGG